MKEIMCPLAEGIVFLKWKRVLRTCDCCPLYNVCKYESNITAEAPQIKCHTYIKFSSCFVHGLLGEGTLSYDLCRDSDLIMEKIKTRKILIMKEVSIGKFMFDFYLPSLQKFVYHIHNVKILSKNLCGVKRRNIFICKPGNLFNVRDYAERLSTYFDLEIQFDHFGNCRSLSIEGCSVEVAMNDSTFSLEFHSHFSDDSRQDTSTTNAHMMKMLDNMRQKNKM